MRRRAFVPLLVMLLGLASARTWAIELGDPAPPLAVAKWLKGGPVNLAAGKGKNVYVIEFWATWCPPCVKNIPQLTKLQRKYKDKGVVVIGVTQEPQPVVNTFMKRRGAGMGYAVAADASGKRGDGGREFPNKNAQSSRPAGKNTDDGITLAIRGTKSGKQAAKTTRIGQSGQTTTAYMKAFAISSIPHAFIVDKEGRLAWHGHPEETAKTLDAILAGTYDLAAARETARKEKIKLQMRPVAREYFAIVQSDGDRKRAAELGAQFVTGAREVPEVLEVFAWAILTAEGLPFRDRELAVRAAKRACEATEEKKASMLDTYARGLFDTGKIGEAIRYETLAIQRAANNRERAYFARILQQYQQAHDQKQ